METVAQEPGRESADAVDVILRDGSTLRLRLPVAGAAAALVAFFASLSEQSRRLRFHGVTRVDRASVEHFLEPDWVERGALAGFLSGGAAGPRVVAVAEYMRLRDPASAEI